jgi:hypothetical protein
VDISAVVDLTETPGITASVAAAENAGAAAAALAAHEAAADPHPGYLTAAEASAKALVTALIFG